MRRRIQRVINCFNIMNHRRGFLGRGTGSIASGWHVGRWIAADFLHDLAVSRQISSGQETPIIVGLAAYFYGRDVG
jgi:hypothetical protein